MVDKLKEIPKKIMEWWNKFTPTQKTIIVSVVAGVVVAFAILITLVTRPVYDPLVTTESTKETAQITSLLDGDGITYQVSDDGYQISVLRAQKSQATLLLGANNIPTQGYDLSNVTSGGFSGEFSVKHSSKTHYMRAYQNSVRCYDGQSNSGVYLFKASN